MAVPPRSRGTTAAMRSLFDAKGRMRGWPPRHDSEQFRSAQGVATPAIPQGYRHHQETAFQFPCPVELHSARYPGPPADDQQLAAILATQRGAATSSRKQADIHGIRLKWRIHPKDVHLYRRAEDRHVGVSLKPLLDWCDRHFGLATRLPSSVSPPLSCDAKAYNTCMKHFNITAARWP